MFMLVPSIHRIYQIFDLVSDTKIIFILFLYKRSMTIRTHKDQKNRNQNRKFSFEMNGSLLKSCSTSAGNFIVKYMA